MTTDTRFEIDYASPDPARGRELVGLVEIPDLQAAAIAYAYQGDPWSTEAAAWIAAVQTADATVSPQRVARTLNWEDTLAFLTTEHLLGRLLAQRGIFPAAALSLTPFRENEQTVLADTTLTPVPDYLALRIHLRARKQELLNLEQWGGVGAPAYRLHAVHAHALERLGATIPESLALRNVAAAVYRVCALRQPDMPLLFRSPVDVLREFLHSGDLDPAYRDAPEFGVPSGDLGPAAAAMDAYFAALTGAARPVETIEALFTDGDPLDACPLLLEDAVTAQRLALVDPAGRTFPFPTTLGALPLSRTATAMDTSIFRKSWKARIRSAPPVRPSRRRWT